MPAHDMLDIVHPAVMVGMVMLVVIVMAVVMLMAVRMAILVLMGMLVHMRMEMVKTFFLFPIHRHAHVCAGNAAFDGLLRFKNNARNPKRVESFDKALAVVDQLQQSKYKVRMLISLPSCSCG